MHPQLARSPCFWCCYTVLEWLVIADASTASSGRFRPPRSLGFTDVVIVLGFVASAASCRSRAWAEACKSPPCWFLTEFFGVGLEAASGIALVLWMISFVVIVPVAWLWPSMKGLSGVV